MYILVSVYICKMDKKIKEATFRFEADIKDTFYVEVKESVDGEELIKQEMDNTEDPLNQELHYDVEQMKQDNGVIKEQIIQENFMIEKQEKQESDEIEEQVEQENHIYQNIGNAEEQIKQENNGEFITGKCLALDNK